MKNVAYWKAHAEALTEAELKKAEEVAAELEKAYFRAIRDVEKDIYAWYARYAVNDKISFTEAKKILDKKELAELKWTIEEYIKYGKANTLTEDWMHELERASIRAHISRLEALQLEITQKMKVLSSLTDNKLTKATKNIYRDSYYQTSYDIEIGTGIGISLTKLDSKKLETIIKKPWSTDNKTFSTRIWDNNIKIINTLQQELSQAIIRGTSPQKTIQSITHQFEVSRSNAERLVLTESSFFSSKATHDSYKDLGIEKYQFLATLDHRTSELCQSMDGKIFKLSDYKPGVTAPPLHPNCRSTTIGYFDENYGNRIAKNNTGEAVYIPADMTYKVWKKKFIK